VPALTLERIGGSAGQWACAGLHVPDTAPFFGDHFPRQPVFPGSLLMQANLELAAALAAEFPMTGSPGRWRVRTVSDLKLRAFIPPGDRVEIEARLEERSNCSAVVAVTTQKGQRIIGGARVRLTLEDRP
jgi:3-hydroxyacyl-[acyl-carrier-protein] dehydratase